MRKLTKSIQRAAFISLSALAFTQIHAESGSSDQETIQFLKKQLEELDQKVKILERKDELAEEESAKKLKETPKISASDRGFSIESADKNYLLRIRGLFQFDNRNFLSPSSSDSSIAPSTAATDDSFLVRRARPIFQGTLFNNFEFLFVPEFGPVTTGGAVTLQDAFVNANFWKEAQLRVGRFKGPFGLERSQSSASTTFIEAGLPQNLTPNFDQGILLHGNVENGLFQYGVGVVNGVGDNASGGTAIDDEYDFVGSLFTHPFRATDITQLHGFGFGVAGTIGTHGDKGTTGGAPSAAFVSPAQQSIFSHRLTTFADGESRRLSPNGYYYWGSLGLLGEYIISSQEVERTTAPFSKGTINNTAWQVVGSYVLTGEDASYNGVIPKNPFSLQNKNWGAWEIAARYGELNLDEEAFGAGANSFSTGIGRAQNVGIGLNWYLNRNIKAQLNFDHTDFEGGNAARQSENAVLTRLQLAF